MEKSFDIFHDEELRLQESDMAEELVHQAISRVVILPLTYPTESLTGRPTDNSVRSFTPDQVPPVGRLNFRDIGLDGLRMTEVATVS